MAQSRLGRNWNKNKLKRCPECGAMISTKSCLSCTMKLNETIMELMTNDNGFEANAAWNEIHGKNLEFFSEFT